ncbi:MAG: DUF1653 domain-containing protein [Clostridiales bacterium]|nr:DUF1653 domain-containing protein [Clostridiales bacterium]
MSNVCKGDIYRHFKGNVYRVTAIAKDCENLQDIVVYENIEKGDTWVRPLSNFTETVTRDGKTFLRFEKVKSGDEF